MSDRPCVSAPLLVPTAVSVVLGMLLCSCSGPSGPTTYEVTGVVLHNGAPIEGATVSFEPVDGTSTSLGGVAETDAEGRFSLQTHIGNNQFRDGLPAGEYGITITKLEQVADMRRRPKDLLPRKYKSVKTSGLSAVVEATDNEFEFVLE